MLKVEFLSQNLGSDLIKKIYAKGYELEATYVLVKRGKYGKYAIVDMYECNDCICIDYCVSL